MVGPIEEIMLAKAKWQVLFISGLGGDTRRYRCFHHQEQLAAQGVATEFRESDDPQLLVDALDYDVFVLHRVPYSQLIDTVIDVAHLRGKPVVFETDDLVFAPDVYEHIGFVDTLPVEAARKFRNDLELLVETFQQCDCALTTTRFLSEEISRRDKAVYIHRNAPSSEMIRLSEQAFAARCERWGKEDTPVVMAYFSGTGSHNRDFRVVTEPLLWALETYPNVWLHISGHLELGPEFAPFHSRVRRAPYVDWRELPDLIARIDINLSPLERDNPFCRAKSENKFVEAALVGVPTIASRVDAYEFAIVPGETGLLADSPDEWKEALQTLLDDPVKRREMGDAARRIVYANYTPERRAEELLGTLQDIVDRYGGASASHEQIMKVMVKGVRDYARQMHADGSAQEAQIAALRDLLGQYEEQLLVLSQTIEAIMQGRVMRFVRGVERRLGRSNRGNG